jgi:hypothetical protein
LNFAGVAQTPRTLEPGGIVRLARQLTLQFGEMLNGGYVNWRMQVTRGFVIDLSYYDSFNDEPGEPSEMENPRYLCLDNAEDIQEVWYER